MKRFIVSVLGVSVFCVGLGAIVENVVLGAIVENVGARFKSDEKALALIKQARLAIGGDQSLAEIRSMVIKGSTTHTFKIGTDLDFCTALLDEKHVACVPGSAFGEPRAMRISYTCAQAQLDEGLRRIQQFFSELA